MSSETPLKIAVLGASGIIGRLIAAEAVGRGHSVTAVARDSSRLADLVGVIAVAADVLDPDSLRRVAQGHDAVIASLSGRPPRPRDTMQRAARLLLELLPQARVNRLVFVGGGATLERAPGVRFLDGPDFPSEYRQEAEAGAEALDIFRGSDRSLKWSYLSPPPLHLVDGERTGVFRVAATDQPLLDEQGESRITNADLAVAVVDAVENETFIRQRFTAAY